MCAQPPPRPPPPSSRANCKKVVCQRTVSEQEGEKSGIRERERENKKRGAKGRDCNGRSWDVRRKKKGGGGGRKRRVVSSLRPRKRVAGCVRRGLGGRGITTYGERLIAASPRYG